ncbi:GNAT family N-acetyltransferase [Curtobacterium ammoniigenes]|uniref:GNAT family N-acetyltransferase n=1 Tax=Curtobacterium ammoniigenes TaxID=395387 RepID=UPI000830A410|nr:GNAT family N-acetyltransferase [Curtobacterium ammoniigenes]
MSTPAPVPSVVTIAIESFDSADAQRLRAAQRIEIDAAYGYDTEPGEKPTADDMVVFFVARDSAGSPVGCGGLRMVADGVPEVKRMYVRSEHRGTGVAVQLLRRLEEAADAMEAPAIVLETGTEQHAAIRFYEREGYRRIANFGPYAEAPLSVCYAKVLQP